MEKGKPAYLAGSAVITGEVYLGDTSSVWHNSTLRGDLAPITVGERSNVQDGAVIHVAVDLPATLGDDVTVGHGAIIHGCSVGNTCLIGMGSILLNGCEIGAESIIGAGALVTEGKKFPPRSLILGNPAHRTREVSEEEVRQILDTAASYVELAEKAQASEAGLYKADRVRHTGDGSNLGIEDAP